MSLVERGSQGSAKLAELEAVILPWPAVGPVHTCLQTLGPWPVAPPRRATAITYPKFVSLLNITMGISCLTDPQNINQGYILKPQYRPHFNHFGAPDIVVAGLLNRCSVELLLPSPDSGYGIDRASLWHPLMS